MPIHNLIEYSDNHLRTSESLWQYYGDEPFININNSAIIGVPDDTDSASFRYQPKITGQTGNNGTKDI